MARFGGIGVGGLLIFALFVFCIFDIIATDSALIRNLPKITWLFVAIIVPLVGPLAWLALGRPINAGWSPGATYTRPPSQRTRGPEDDDNWGRGDSWGRR